MSLQFLYMLFLQKSQNVKNQNHPPRVLCLSLFQLVIVRTSARSRKDGPVTRNEHFIVQYLYGSSSCSTVLLISSRSLGFGQQFLLHPKRLLLC